MGAANFRSGRPLIAFFGGVVAVALVWWRVRWLPRRARQSVREQTLLDLAFAGDLLAASTGAGISPRAALGVVGPYLGGPVGEWLSMVGRSLQLGTGADVAWRTGIAGWTGAESETAITLGRLMSEAETEGIAPGPGLRTFARQVRADIATAELERVRRAGIAVVGPLGLCFLPAFVLVSVVPVVATSFRHAVQ